MLPQTVGDLLPGVHVVRLGRSQDTRGEFVKTFARSALASVLADFELHEEFYSTSARDVVRGMHFQAPPYQHVKLVYCARGAVLDVVLDLRRGPGFGRFSCITLDANTPTLLIIPAGVAHGFRSLVDGSLMVYKTNAEYRPSHDLGIRWDSFGHDWGVTQPIVSARDAAHPVFGSFESPF